MNHSSGKFFLISSFGYRAWFLPDPQIISQGRTTRGGKTTPLYLKMKKVQFIKEQEAAQQLGYGSAIWFRRLVKSGRIRVQYTHIRGRNFQYNKEDLDNLLIQNASTR